MRLYLAKLVCYFRKLMAKAGLLTTGGLFPVQTLEPISAIDATILHKNLLRCGIRTVLHRYKAGCHACISFLISVLHSLSDIDHAVDALMHATGIKKSRILEVKYAV